MISPDQIRAARALKGWSQSELSNHTGLTTPTIANIELGKQKPSAATLQKIYDAFDIAEIEFTEGEGVRKKTGRVHIYSGSEGFQTFYQDVDATALELNKGEFLVCNVDERDFISWLNEESTVNHYQVINKTKIAYRILISEGDDYTPGLNFDATYRWTPKSQFYSVPYYVYGDKVAFIGFEKDNVNVFVVQNHYFSQLCRRQFDEMWERSLKPALPGVKNMSLNKKVSKAKPR